MLYESSLMYDAVRAFEETLLEPDRHTLPHILGQLDFSKLGRIRYARSTLFFVVRLKSPTNQMYGIPLAQNS